MPLRDAEGNIIGTFGVSTDITARKLAEMESAHLLDEMGGQAEELRSAVADMTIIQETVSALTVATTFEDAVKTLLPAVTEAVQASQISMFLVEDDYMTRVGLYPMSEADSARIGEKDALADYPLTQDVIASQRPLVVSADDPRLQEHARQAYKTAGIVASATIPLVGREGILGTLAVSLTSSEDASGKGSPGKTAFTEHDIRILQMLADQTTLTFENIRLLEQTRARVERERQVRAITDKIRRGADRDAIMRTTLQELSRMFDAPEAIIRLGIQERLESTDTDPPAS